MSAEFAVRAGERLLWEGRPDAARFMFNPFLLIFVVFFTVWFLGFSTLLFTPSRNGPPTLLLLFPVLFFAVFFFAPTLIGGWLSASRTRYFVTDRRVVIDGFRRRQELDLTTLPYLELERSLMGTASIYFAPRSPYETWAGFGMWGGRSAPAFRAVRDADKVYEMIARARDEAKSK